MLQKYIFILNKQMKFYNMSSQCHSLSIFRFQPLYCLCKPSKHKRIRSRPQH